VLDLDSTLYDNRWRTAAIVHEYAEQEQEWSLVGLTPACIEDWSLERTLANHGLSEETIQRLVTPLKPFWSERFFSGAYCTHDRAMPGAVRFVQALSATGVDVIYLTGRDERQRDASLASLQRWQFPLNRGSESLWTKQDSSSEDADFKAVAMEGILERGPLVVAIDNEPIQINQMSDRSPDALCIWMDTDHSFRPVRPHARLLRIQGFLKTSD